MWAALASTIWLVLGVTMGRWDFVAFALFAFQFADDRPLGHLKTWWSSHRW